MSNRSTMQKEIMGLNIPNFLTLTRVVLIVPFVAVMLICKGVGPLRWVALALFLISAFTDMFDGKIARKYELVTDFGKFMDPLADKVLVSAAMILLVEIGRLPSYICIIIIAREFIISGFRLIAADKGIVIAAGMWGKIKTVVQMVMVSFLIVYTLGEPLAFLEPPLCVIRWTLIWASCALTLISLADYLYRNRQVLGKSSEDK